MSVGRHNTLSREEEKEEEEEFICILMIL